MMSRRFLGSLLPAVVLLVFNTPTLWAQETGFSECLDQPITVSYSRPDSGAKVKSVGKGIFGGLLGKATGGAVGTRSGDNHKLARRPRYSKSKLHIAGTDLELEYQGKLDEGVLKTTVRVHKDPGKGGPHLVVLQDIHCRVLLPSKVDVFELWGKGSLSVSWSSSSYENGSLVGTEGGGWDTSWTDFKVRYPNTSEIPGIWQRYSEPPFNGIRGITAAFQLPAGETFNPKDWYLITHVTRPGSPGTVTTEPVVTEMGPGKKHSYAFDQTQTVAWQPPTARTAVTALVGAMANVGLVCREDCEKIREEIKQLECAREDCSDKKAAVDAALAALADAQQALVDAQNALERSEADVAEARTDHDQALADKDRADRKLAVESVKQNRLQISLARGGLGLRAEQTVHGIEFSRDVVKRLEEEAADAQAALEAAQAALNAANTALQAANQAVSAATAAVEGAQQGVDDAKQALNDCMQGEWERCQTIDELWGEYENCRKRCRDQDEVRSDINRAGRQIRTGQADMDDAAEGYKHAKQVMNNANSGVRELGGDISTKAQDMAREAAESRRQAELSARAAEQRLRKAGGKYARGDLEGAREAAHEARDLQNQATDAMDDSADRMREAAGQARRRYQNELNNEYQRRQREWVEQRRAAQLKKQVCMRHLAEYFAGDGNNSFLVNLGGFVSGEAQQAIEQAGDVPFSPEGYQEFLGKLEEQRHRLEQILTLLNGIGDNASMESRNKAFGTAVEIAGEIADRIPGLGAFFNFYSSAYNAAVQALYGLQQEIIDKYKPLVDHFIRRGGNCCSYSYEQLKNMSLEDVVNERWERFHRSNSVVLSGISTDTLRKLEDYFKSRLTIKWATCCLEFALNG